MRGKALSTSMMLLAFLAVAVAPAAAQTPAPPRRTAAVPAPAPTPPAATGGAAYGVVFQPTVPGVVAQIVNGVAYAPDQAPDQVKQAIWAANPIVGMPYRLGGGHRLGFTDHAYDCSGTVSFAMHGAGLLAKPRDSSSFMRYGAARQGRSGSRSTPTPATPSPSSRGCAWTRARPAIPPAARARAGARTCARRAATRPVTRSGCSVARL